MDTHTYHPEDREKWDKFVRGSKNGTFLFLRDYMDYHSDRFLDHSLIVQDDNGRVKSVMPANRSGDVLLSHAGLTYGGFVTDEGMTAPRMKEVFECAIRYLAARGVSRLIYKTVPHIYHSQPAEEDIYFLLLHNASLFRRDVLSVIDYRQRLKFQERRLRAIRKARGRQLTVRKTDDYPEFWEILTGNLYNVYGLRPVHSLSEIRLLASRFPEEIRLFATYDGSGSMQAGAVVYLSPNVCHIQYNAASEEGKSNGALDILVDHLIEYYGESRRYFDFGVSTEDGGRHLNVGLVDYKEGFGARTIAHDFYELTISRAVGE
ncbi:MAG TPA: GNAT family N-acetyltransferase [Blastocatellia bacterium]|nr:GNAT family N-acetyltransferase [Blastocatellia bacterium]